MDGYKIARWLTPRHAAQFGTVLTLLLFASGYFVSWRIYRSNFENDAELKSTVVIDSLKNRLEELDEVRTFLEATGPVDRDLFRKIISALADRQGILGLGWVPVVPARQRAAVELEAQRSGLTGFHITQLAPDESLVPAAPRPVYYPLFFLEPQGRNGQVIGFDEGSEPRRLAALRMAEKTGDTMATEPVRLVLAKGHPYGVLLFSPVRTPDRQVSGFVMGVFKTGEELGGALLTTSSMSIDTTLDDIGAPPGEQRLFAASVPEKIARQFPRLDDLLFPQPSYRKDFSFAGRSWRLTCRATRGYHADTASLTFLLSLPVGLLITWLACRALRQQALSRAEVEQMVSVRTAQLSRAKREWELTFDTVPDLIMLLDREMRVMRVNRAQAERSGVEPAELIGKSCCDIIHGADAPPDFCAFHSLLATGKEKVIDVWLPNLQGHFFISLTPLIDDTGEVVGTVHVSRDITKLKQYEETILNNQRELEELNASLEVKIAEEIKQSRSKDLIVMQQDKLASIGQLAAGVAHVINTPIGFISGNMDAFNKHFDKLSRYLKALEDFVERSTPEEQRQELTRLSRQLDITYLLTDIPELIDESRDGTKQVSQIVRDLKRFSQVDTGGIEWTDLTECLDSVLSVLTHELKQATVEREYDDLPSIRCNPGEVNQVLLNLLLNASKAVGSAGLIRVKCWSDDSFVNVSVADNGHGIPEEIRSRILEPFFTTKDVGQGTGLGLSVSLDIITKHRGELLVESTVGQGSTFTVKLPRNSAGSEDATPEETE